MNDPTPRPWPVSDGVVSLRLPRPGEDRVLLAGRDDVWERFLGPGDDQPAPTAVIVVDDQIVGWVDYETGRDWLCPDEVNIGYNVFPPYRRRHYATRALNLLLGFLWDHTTYRRANLVIDLDNVASLGVARAVGARILSETLDEFPSSIRHVIDLALPTTDGSGPYEPDTDEGG